MTVLKVRDETTTGEVTLEFELVFPGKEITVKELIETRVREEVFNYNKNAPGLFKGLVQPEAAEKRLNGFSVKKNKKIDPEIQVKKALDAFGTSSLLVIVNDRQVETLEEKIIITSNTTVSFLKLVALVGG